MKPLVYLFLSMIVSFSAQALESNASANTQSSANFIENLAGRFNGGRPGLESPGMSARPIVTCSASDNGWEEHWRGHRTCQECLRKHSNCRETCQVTIYTCEAQGVDYRGYVMRIYGRDYSQWDAQRQTLWACQRYYRNCHITQCTTSAETVSRRSCR